MKARAAWGSFLSGVLLAFLVAPVAFAEAIDINQRVSEIVAQQKEIQAEAKEGRRGWDAVPKEQRAELLSRQEQLFTLLSGKETIADLNDMDQVEVANTLEWIKALVTNAEDERKVCQRERKTGSNRIATVCRTAGSIRKEREMVKDAMQRRRLPPPDPRADL